MPYNTWLSLAVPAEDEIFCFMDQGQEAEIISKNRENGLSSILALQLLTCRRDIKRGEIWKIGGVLHHAKLLFLKDIKEWKELFLSLISSTLPRYKFDCYKWKSIYIKKGGTSLEVWSFCVTSLNTVTRQGKINSRGRHDFSSLWDC